MMMLMPSFDKIMEVILFRNYDDVM